MKKKSFLYLSPVSLLSKGHLVRSEVYKFKNICNKKIFSYVLFVKPLLFSSPFLSEC